MTNHQHPAVLSRSMMLMVRFSSSYPGDSCFPSSSLLQPHTHTQGNILSGSDWARTEERVSPLLSEATARADAEAREAAVTGPCAGATPTSPSSGHEPLHGPAPSQGTYASRHNGLWLCLRDRRKVLCMGLL